MTADTGERTAADGEASATREARSTTESSVLRTAVRRIRADPMLLVPLTVAGLLVAVADWIRRVDPIPAARPHLFGQTVGIQYSLFPSGTARTIRRGAALVDLRPPFLAGAVALELLVVSAVGVAGWLTITRALGTERRLRSLARYLGVLAVLALLFRVLENPVVEFDSLVLGVAGIVVLSLVAVRLFLVPGFLAADRRFAPSLRASARASEGWGWTIFWLILAFGIASWGLAQIPVAGGFLSTLVVAPVHAVAIAVLVRETDETAGTTSR
ncbi:hypothetical protein [Haloarcula amylovorans]|uniref:hypothetical protein n=1 Tax=Haloarcula amylovorans TaxID=2562280 RepID=UPI001075F6D1|nr:hypothetical protein [Halomicroarcula amylolytica]